MSGFSFTGKFMGQKWDATVQSESHMGHVDALVELRDCDGRLCWIVPKSMVGIERAAIEGAAVVANATLVS